MEPPCVVLVIDDNPYRLMVTPSYVCRTYPYTMLEPYVGFKVVRKRLCDDQGVIQGVIQRLVLREFSLCQVCIEE
jgi:hypothetical protein